MDQGGDGFHIGYAAKMVVRHLDDDPDTIYVVVPIEQEAQNPEASTLSPEETSVTTSKYGRTVKIWRRGGEAKSIAEAKTVLTVPTDYVLALTPETTMQKECYAYDTNEDDGVAGGAVELRTKVIFEVWPSFYKRRLMYYDTISMETVRLAVPDEIIDLKSYFDYYIITLRDDRWGFPAGSVLICYFDELLEVSRKMTRKIAQEKRMDSD